MAARDCTCKTCGTAFLSGSRGRMPLHCPGCAKLSRAPSRVGKWADRAKRGPFVCGCCGVSYMTRNKEGEGEKFCSRDCASNASRAVRYCTRCGSPFYGKVDSRSVGCYCGRSCYQSSRSAVASEADALRRIARSWRPNPAHTEIARLVAREVSAIIRIARWKPGNTRTVRPCFKCGSKAAGKGDHARQCGSCRISSEAETRRRMRRSPAARASKSAYKAKRRAAEQDLQADKIDPIAVFNRDKWKCHLCGVKTPRALRGSYEDTAPELDHILPLALGGSHTWGNVACSCRKCNGRKGATPLGQVGFDFAA